MTYPSLEIIISSHTPIALVANYISFTGTDISLADVINGSKTITITL